MLGNAAYPTYQAFISLAVAAVIAAVIMPLWIRVMRIEHFGQQVRADGPEQHLIKQGTPTMGGVVILVALAITCLVMGRLTAELALVLIATLATGVLGLIDDLTSVTHGRSLGLTPHAKMIGLTLICVLFCLLSINWCGVEPVVRFPGGLSVDLGVLTTTVDIAGEPFHIPWLYMIFTWLLIVGLSNAVNLTDGLDGLAGGTSMIAMLVMAAVCFICNDSNLTIFCAACAGACLGFLWFNCYPASIFMGDTGSLALACVAVMTNTEAVSLIVGGLFIIETLSVMIQVVSFKLTGKRVFLMAPIHHHFEKKGWAETKVVIRFWIIAAAFGALGLAVFFQLG